MATIDEGTVEVLKQIAQGQELKSVTQLVDGLKDSVRDIATQVKTGNEQNQKTMDLLIKTESERSARIDNELNGVKDVLKMLAANQDQFKDSMMEYSKTISECVREMAENRVRTDQISKGLEMACAKADACVEHNRSLTSTVDRLDGDHKASLKELEGKLDVVRANQVSNKELASAKVDWVGRSLFAVIGAGISIVMVVIKELTGGS